MIRITSAAAYLSMLTTPAVRLCQTLSSCVHQDEDCPWQGTPWRDVLGTYPGTPSTLDAGNDLGPLTRWLYGPGQLIGYGENASKALTETEDVLQYKGRRHTLYEAAFQYQDVLIRANVLKPALGGYDLICAQPVTAIRSHHLVDCAIQMWVIQHAGIKLRRVFLAYLNPTFVYGGDDDYAGLLLAEKVTDEVVGLVGQVPRWVRKLQHAMLSNKRSVEGEPPTGSFPAQCCLAREPQGPKYAATIFKFSATLAKVLLDEGFADRRKVPVEGLANATRQRPYKPSISTDAFPDPASPDTIEGLPYPRYYVSVETASLVIPRWAGTRPCQPVPFQWSCQIERRNEAIAEREFLDLSGDDPTRNFAESLLRTLAKRGPILVYNKNFVACRIADLARWFPDLEGALLALNERMVDLLPVTQAFCCHPTVSGSWAQEKVVRAVIPAIDIGEAGDVVGGDWVQRAYIDAIDPERSIDRRTALDAALRWHGRRHAMAMVCLRQALTGC